MRNDVLYVRVQVIAEDVAARQACVYLAVDVSPELKAEARCDTYR